MEERSGRNEEGLKRRGGKGGGREKRIYIF
jgi:hypothetical protein